MSFNPFFYANRDSKSPASGSFSITPNDNSDLPTYIRAVTLGQPGTLSWNGIDGAAYSTATLPAGTYPMFARRIRATGTTASQITGWV